MPKWDMECNDCEFVEEKLFLIGESLENDKCNKCGGKTTKIYSGKISVWTYNDDSRHDNKRMFGGGSTGVNKTQVNYTKRKILEKQTGLSYRQKIPIIF